MDPLSNLFTIAFTIFLVIDALGNIPVFLSLITSFPRKKQRQIVLRELIFALVIMILFHFLGQLLLSSLNVSKSTVQISGGLILFLIAIRLIFKDEEPHKWGNSEPFIVPIATPIIAGPSVLAVVMIFAQDEPSDLIVLGAIFFAWLFSSFVFLAAKPIFNLIKDKGLMACQRLMGLIVALIAVQMFLQGVEGLIKHQL